MHDLEVSRDAVKEKLFVLVVHAKLLRLPVDVPGAHGAVAPGPPLLHRVEVNEDKAVVGYTQELLGGVGSGGGEGVGMRGERREREWVGE